MNRLLKVKKFLSNSWRLEEVAQATTSENFGDSKKYRKWRQKV